MGRPVGSRNAGYDERRRAIAARVLARLSEPEGSKASLRDLAQSAGVCVATLRHYFGDREGAVQAAMQEVRARAENWLTLGAEAQLSGTLEESLTWFLRTFQVGWTNGVGPMVSESLAAGMGNPALGQSAVNEVLEPMLRAIESRLGHHQRAGQLPPHVNLRHAGLSLITPLIMAMLHQDSLSGSSCRPLDVDAFIADHVHRFVAGWTVAAG